MDANFMRDLYLSPFDVDDSGNGTRRVALGHYVQTSLGGQTDHPDVFAFIPDFTSHSQGVVSGASTGPDDDGNKVDLSEFCTLFTPDDNLNQIESHASPAPTLQPFSIDQPLPFPSPLTEPVESSYWRGLNVTLPLPPSPTPAEAPLFSALTRPRPEGPNSSTTGSRVIQPGLDFDDDGLAFRRGGNRISSEIALVDASLPSLSYSPTTSSGTRSLGPETPTEACLTPPLEGRRSPRVKQEEMESNMTKTLLPAFRDIAPQRGTVRCPPSVGSIPARAPRLQVPDAVLQGDRHAGDAHRPPLPPPEAASPGEVRISDPAQTVKTAGKKNAKRKRTSPRSKQTPGSPIVVPLDVSLLTEVITTVRTSDKNSKEFRTERRREKVVPPGVPGNKLSWHKVGEHSVCPFPAIGDATRTCGEYYIDNRKLAAAHVAVHFRDLGLKAVEGNPNVPCYWPGCTEAPQVNNFQRHILDTHLHISWNLCECGGSYSRGQQQSNVRRHEGTEMHQAFLKKKAQSLETTEGKGGDEYQEGEHAEFVQGSSRDGASLSVDNVVAQDASSEAGSRRTGGRKKRKQDTQGDEGELEEGPSTRKKQKRTLKREKPLP